MIALPCSSQITFIIKDSTYTCYTPTENRTIAYLLFEGDINKQIVDSYSYEAIQFEKLIEVYKNDSVICRSVINNINEKYITVQDINNKLKKEIVDNNRKIKNRNIVIGVLAGIEVVGIGALILSIFK